MDVGGENGVTRQHKVLLKWTPQQVHDKEFVAVQDSEKEKIGADTKERYLAYIFL